MTLSLLPGLRNADGLITRAAITEAGVTRGTISSWLRLGILAQVLPRQYRLRGDALGFRSMCAAASAWAGPGSALSHHTAAALHGIELFIAEPPIHVSVRGTPKTPQSAFALEVHTGRDLDLRRDCQSHGHLRITTLERTVFDLSSVLSTWSLGRVVDEVVRRGLVKGDKLEAVCERVRKRGRDGSAKFSNVLHVRRDRLVRLDSGLEAKFLELFIAEDVPRPESYFWIAKWDALYRADFAYPQYQLAIEIDSWKYHGTLEDWTNDVTKSNDLVSWGWSVLRFTQEDLKRPRYVAQVIREALVSRGW